MQNIINNLERLTPNSKHKTGAKYILFLIKHPNRYFAYFMLEMIINETVPDNLSADIYYDYIDKFKYLNLPVKMTDRQTISDIKDRLNTLNCQIAHAESMNLHNIIPDLCSEKEQLISYLKEVLKEYGGIKHFTEQSKASKKAVKLAIKRFISEINIKCPELANEVLNGLKMDSYGIGYEG